MGNLCSISGLGRSLGRGHGNTLQYSCLDNPMDRRAWWATVHGVTRVRQDWEIKHSTQHHVFYLLYDFIFLLHFFLSSSKLLFPFSCLNMSYLSLCICYLIFLKFFFYFIEKYLYKLPLNCHIIFLGFISHCLVFYFLNFLYLLMRITFF